MRGAPVAVEARLARRVRAELWHAVVPNLLKALCRKQSDSINKTHLAAELRLKRGLGKAFDSDPLSNLGTLRRGHKLNDFVVLTCPCVINNSGRYKTELTGSRENHGVGKQAAHLGRLEVANGHHTTPSHRLERNLARKTA
jgi:hypothetical protein